MAIDACHLLRWSLLSVGIDIGSTTYILRTNKIMGLIEEIEKGHAEARGEGGLVCRTGMRN